MAISNKQREMILADLEEGASLRQACRNADVPAPSTVLDLAERDPAFGEQYARARQMGYKLLADALVAVADDPDIPADHKRIQVDTRKWMLSKMLPKLYGDKLDLTLRDSSKDQLSDEELQAVLAARPTQGRGKTD